MNDYILFEILTCCKVITGAVLVIGLIYAADTIRRWADDRKNKD